LKWLWTRLGKLVAINVTREEMLMKPGAALEGSDCPALHHPTISQWRTLFLTPRVMISERCILIGSQL